MTELFGALPILEMLVGMMAMAGLFVLFGVRPQDPEQGCGSCGGDCGSCSLDHEESV